MIAAHGFTFEEINAVVDGEVSAFILEKYCDRH
jgi:hypothetical protein